MLEKFKSAADRFAKIYTEWRMCHEIAYTLADHRIAKEQRQLLQARLDELNTRH
jgi:hypothetical protein